MTRTAMAVAVCSILAARTPDIRVDVDLVTVPCAVDRSDGTPAGGLKAEDFTLLDDGQAREIRSFWRESDLPFTVALVADISGSQTGYIASHREAIGSFLTQVIGPRDRAMVVAVAQKMWLVSGLTASTGDLADAAQRIGTPAGKQAELLGPALPQLEYSSRLRRHGAMARAFLYGSRAQSREGPKSILLLPPGMRTDFPGVIALPSARIESRWTMGRTELRFSRAGSTNEIPPVVCVTRS